MPIFRRRYEIYVCSEIDNWLPVRPHRWLAKYGSLPADGYACVVEHYRRIRKEAEAMCSRHRVYGSSGLSAHSLLLSVPD